MITETQIVNQLVASILAKGYSISLDAEGEPFLEGSRNKDEILRQIDASDMITVRIDEDRGWFLLIWGNDEDIISDFSDNRVCLEIYDEVSDAVGL